MRRCMAHIGIDHILYTSDLQEINLQVNGTKRLLRANFLKEWEAKRSDLKKTTDSKVCLLSHMKIKFGYEDYLSVCPNQRDRMALSKFRVSAHNLPVEVGRYAGTTRENRICPFCSIRTGDEQHYLCECPNSIFSSLRDPLHSFINSNFPGFNSLDPIQKTIFILGNTDPKVISKVARFCNQLMTMFREHNTRTVWINTHQQISLSEPLHKSFPGYIISIFCPTWSWAIPILPQGCLFPPLSYPPPAVRPVSRSPNTPQECHVTGSVMSQGNTVSSNRRFPPFCIVLYIIYCLCIIFVF